MQEDFAIAQRHPLKHVLWTAGDFNFLPVGEVSFNVNNPMRTGDVQAATSSTFSKRAWLAILKATVEIQQYMPTRYNVASDTYNRLDLVYTSLPPWAPRSTTCTTRIVKDPRALNTNGISDHARILVSLSVRRALPPDKRAIPRETFVQGSTSKADLRDKIGYPTAGH